MPTLADYLQQLVQQEAESLQLRPDQPPTLFIDRQPRPLAGPPLTAREVEALLEFLLDAEGRAAWEARGLAEGTHIIPQWGAFAFRARRLPEGPALAFRPAAVELLTAQRPVGPAPALPTAGATPPPMTGGQASSAQGPTLEALLRTAWQRGASDIILSSGLPATLRLAGELQSVPGAIYSEEQLFAALGPVVTPERRAQLATTGHLDLAVDLVESSSGSGGGGATWRFRVNVFRQLRGYGAAFRPIWDRIPDRESLHLPAELLSIVDQPHGLILVVGPTGAGKSTTLAVLLEHINRSQARHVITLEDPIEHIFKPSRSLMHQREVGLHVDSFAQGLRAALRECPDVILVGEMRDLDTISATLTAAETGHLVLSTLHSGSATQAIDRMIDVFPQHQQSQVRIQLSDVLRCVITQRLLPKADGKGRVPALEVVRVGYAFANMIREKKTHLFQSQIQTTQKDGNLPFDLSLARLVREGSITLETAGRAAHDPQYLRTVLAQSGG